MNLSARFRAGLRRTAEHLVGRVDEVSARGGPPTDRGAVDPTLEALEEILISSDVGLTATARIVDAVSGRLGEGRLRDLVKAEILAVLTAADAAPPNGVPLRVVLVVGVNGTGKTTTVGKLAKRLKSTGGRPLICAADTFRAAAVDQLDIWASRAEVGLVKAASGADPAAIVHDAIAAARARDRGVVLVDTAGRLHTRRNLMAELEKIRRVAAKEVEGAPHEVLLVLDATVGQNGVAQAAEFVETAGVNGIVLSKLDGTAKGGVAVAVATELGLPIRYVGVGEEIDDLLPFAPGEYVDALFEEGW
ncbi:MAG: signal recognition particle-docking protein FtsY [Vicinamibacterales bacterium]|jgi:fused signal recognition particle receptor|nr:signal recognition particle-docking protein FtsY [Vicinamibacterales bacterium]MDP6609473.1 signal recognition particle-docking protein FtsY [Vicinamibacterales bacterium]HAK56261.1 signal recognition particle-docking protein FtsY [Acidobacteriota bacterium]|tara:strand:- start:393 stop:1307 length:915 start_codon:yes stop_codon:yes gene_type:complete